MTSDGKSPLPSKRYYDIASWLITQLTFAYTVAPFILLTFPRCYAAWSRVYFYCIFGVVLSFAFFASPAKGWLKHRIAARSKPHAEKTTGAHAEGSPLSRVNSQLGQEGGTLGLPDDPENDLNELMDEVKREVQARRERGMSIGQGLQEAVQARLREMQTADAKASGAGGGRRGDGVRSRVSVGKDAGPKVVL